MLLDDVLKVSDLPLVMLVVLVHDVIHLVLGRTDTHVLWLEGRGGVNIHQVIIEELHII